ncbi:MAG: MBL fold metallo-hydrolase [Oscillospiraceae bacterium]|jgi:phosphoribosyl 1,2-cyclic phosphodiesterase|nr:MBL fold metallo-hydrolase [Oscillospiraceae bacterium]
MARICPLFSGSSGNSTLIGSGGQYILIDIGRNAKMTAAALSDCEVEPSRIGAIFITHEHADHIKGLRVFAAKYNIPVYASEGTLRELERGGHLAKVDARLFSSNGEDVAGMHIDSFRTMHDTPESCGYIVHTADGRRAAVATDMGCVTDTVRTAVTGCDTLLIESNHDVRTLENGPYPYYLKRRILSDNGHLSNTACAKELTELVRKGTTRIILAHLSRENNLPVLAYQTALEALTSGGMREKRDFELQVAPSCNGAVTLF